MVAQNVVVCGLYWLVICTANAHDCNVLLMRRQPGGYCMLYAATQLAHLSVDHTDVCLHFMGNVLLNYSLCNKLV